MTNGEKIKELFPDTKIITQYDNPFGDRFMVFTLNNEHMQVNLNWWNAEYKEPTTKNNLAQERYQDLIEYFGGENIITDIVLSDKHMFKAWLDRVRWYIKRANELARELEQLKGTTKNDLGVDCISREQALEPYKILENTDILSVYTIRQNLTDLPSVTPQEPNTWHCKDCKWWKDSDGEYRRGVNAESQCPINRKEVYEGNGYCFLYEPQESEG